MLQKKCNSIGRPGDCRAERTMGDALSDSSVEVNMSVGSRRFPQAGLQRG